MLNHAVRAYLPVFHDQLRTSVLGRTMGRKMRDLQGPSVTDEAKPSPATDERISAFFDAWLHGDEHAQTLALGDVVEAWRADNAAGGVPVHAHLPLPKALADGAANDSVRFERGPGGGGRVEIFTRAFFYEGLSSLPPQFRRNSAPGTPGFDPSIEPAGGLRATSKPFVLPRDSYDSMTGAENNVIYTEW